MKTIEKIHWRWRDSGIPSLIWEALNLRGLSATCEGGGNLWISWICGCVAIWKILEHLRVMKPMTVGIFSVTLERRARSMEGGGSLGAGAESSGKSGRKCRGRVRARAVKPHQREGRL